MGLCGSCRMSELHMAVKGKGCVCETFFTTFEMDHQLCSTLQSFGETERRVVLFHPSLMTCREQL